MVLVSGDLSMLDEGEYQSLEELRERRSGS